MTYDGEPVDVGSISFLPAGENQRVSGGYIENGKIEHWQVTIKLGFRLDD